MKKIAKKVLLIGWDAADWKLINKFMDEGKMPAMKSLVERGVMGNLATLDPPFSPMLWTTIATGVRPDKHGILGFSEPTSNQMGVRPVSSISRKVKAIWNILTQKGLKTHVVGWWPSHPAEPINGVMVSNHFQHVSNSIDKAWQLAAGAVHPPELSGLFAHFRVHPQELTSQHIQPFVPNFYKIDQDKDKHLESIAKIIAEASSIHAAATLILENEEWDFVGVYHDAIDHFGHGFMNFHPPKMQSVPQDMFDLYNGVIEAGYRFHDLMLARMIQLAGDDATIIIVSDHGFHSDHLRPPYIPYEPAGPAYQHRNHGIFCMAGPGVRKDERIYGASLLDITPTLLTLFGLPVGEDMDGTPLVQAFEEVVEIETVPSWEKIEGECGMHPESLKENPYEAQESLQQLVELGYIEDPGENIQEAVERTVKEANYNLSRVYLGGAKYTEALPLLEKLYANEPDQPRFALRLANCYFELGEIEKCKTIIAEFREHEQKMYADKDTIKKLREEKMPEEFADDEKKKEKWAREHRQKITRYQQVPNDIVMLNVLEGDILIKENKPAEALKVYRKAVASAKNKSLLIKTGNALVKLKRWKEAEKSYLGSLEYDADSTMAYQGLAESYIGQRKYYEAADAALTSVGLIYYQPLAHLYLGQALVYLKEYERAEEALRVALAINPNLGLARNLLINVYEKHLKLPEKAAELKAQVLEDEKANVRPLTTVRKDDSNEKIIPVIKPAAQLQSFQPIIVVSGLPRSGTSLMMQMLDIAGIEIFTDKQRTADESNPKGYYEHEAVKRLARDKSWVKDTQNKAVKIISQLLIHLPMRFRYKIIFMERDLHEVVVSQHKMLLKLGAKRLKEDAYPMAIENAFRKNLELVKTWSANKPNVEILYIEHKEAIVNPLEVARKVAAFLGKELDINAMAGVVDKNLYRTKN